MKIDETKLKIASVRAKDRHTRQVEVEDTKWHGINEARKANQLTAAHADDAATAKAALKVSQDRELAAATEAARLALERAEAIAATEAAIAKAEQAENDKRMAEAAAANSEARRSAVIASVRRRGLNKKSYVAPTPTNSQQQPAATAIPSPGWELQKPKRHQGYGRPVYEMLKAAHAANLPRPTARDVLEAFRSNRPLEVSEVLADELKYYDAGGNLKPATVDMIRKTIDRLVR